MFAGTHFFLGFMENEIERGSSLRLQLSIAARAPTTVRVRFPTESQERIYRLNAGEYRWIAVPPELEVRTREQPVASAIEIRSDAPIVVYAFSSQATTTDAYTAIPVVNWGTEYRILSFPNDAYTPRPGDTTINRLRDLILRRSEWMVIAAYDSTVVTFVPRVRTAGGKAAGIPHTVVLNRGECYLVQSDSTPKGLGDMTGTLVQSSKPIGVLSGHVRVSLPLNLPPEADTKDHLVEMLPALPSVGKRYISTPFAIGTGDWFRAVALFPQTQLKLTRATGSIVQTTLQNAGDGADFPAEAAPILWEADKPFLLVQLMYSAVTGGPQALVNPYVSFDPCMVLVPPLEQYVQQAHFFVPDTSLAGFNQFKRHWINVVVSAEALASLQLNGTPLSQRAPQLLTQQLPWTINGMRYHWVQLPVSPGMVAELRCSQGEFAGILYGTGYVDSYALVLGSGLLPPGTSDARAPELLPQPGTCGEITLSCSDTGSGIAWIEPLPDSTWNYTWDYVQPSRTEAILSARPVDLSRDGQLTVEIRDNAGNRRWYRHQYWAPRLSWQPTLVQFLGVGPSETRCQSVLLTNTGRDTLRITALRVQDVRLSLQASPPFRIAPGNSVPIQLCFRPNGTVAPLVDSIWVITECALSFSIPVEATVDSAGLLARGCSVGAVLVGEEGECQLRWINTGNRPVVIRAAQARRSVPAFLLDTAGLFPRTLAAGDTLWLRVRFQPPYRGVFQDTVVLETTPLTSAGAWVDGRGIAPEVHSAQLDWGRRRVGTRSDSLLPLVNVGDAPTQLSILADDNVPELGHGLPLRTTLAPGDTLWIPLWFTPTQRQYYIRRVTLESSWRLHPPIQLTLTGEGSAPELQATAVDFDTLQLGTWRDTVALLLRAAGNEAAVLDSIWLDGPEAAAFVVLSPPALPQRLPPGSSLSLPLRFQPQRVGLHRAWLVFRHNGKPPSASDTLHVLLLGYGQAPPPVDTFTARWDTRVEAPNAVPACEDFSVRLCVRNSGNTVLFCSGVQLQGAPLSAVEPPLPQQLSPGDSLCFSLRLAGIPAGQTVLMLQLQLRSEYVFQDTLHTAEFLWTQRLLVQAQPHPWRIEHIDTLVLQPGEQGSVTITGTLSSVAGSTPAGSLCLRVPPNWRLNAAGAEYTVFDERGQSQQGIIDAAAEYSWGICLHVVGLPLARAAAWQLRLPVGAFVGAEERAPISLRIEPDSPDCVVGDSALGELFLTGLCAARLRPVLLRPLPAVHILRLMPQPASEELLVELESSAETAALIQLVNLRGELLAEWSVQLEEGVALRKFALASVPPGVYCLRLNAAGSREQRLLVIQR
ncbi:hypothetical protein HRbin21_00313 [bacterium HR21]|nr:hypothetical protein HRbin21_00313 [bacterium HR21]